MFLIVAHFQEDLGWLAPLFADGHNAIIYEKGGGNRGPVLPNMGRESHTWLHHIVTHYDQLDDYNVFLQGEPLSHCPDLAEQLRNPRDYADLGNWFENSNDIGRPWRGDCPVGKIYQDFIGQFPGVVDFCVGGQFMASRAQIQKHSCSWWSSLLTRHNNEPFAPWTFERLWPSLLRGSSCMTT